MGTTEKLLNPWFLPFVITVDLWGNFKALLGPATIIR